MLRYVKLIVIFLLAACGTNPLESHLNQANLKSELGPQDSAQQILRTAITDGWKGTADAEILLGNQNINQRDNSVYKRTTLLFAIQDYLQRGESGTLSWISFLLSHGADPNAAEDPVMMNPPLLFSFMQGEKFPARLKIVTDQLLKAGADPTTCNRSKITPRQFLESKGNKTEFAAIIAELAKSETVSPRERNKFRKSYLEQQLNLLNKKSLASARMSQLRLANLIKAYAFMEGFNGVEPDPADGSTVGKISGAIAASILTSKEDPAFFNDGTWQGQLFHLDGSATSIAMQMFTVREEERYRLVENQPSKTVFTILTLPDNLGKKRVLAEQGYADRGNLLRYWDDSRTMIPGREYLQIPLSNYYERKDTAVPGKSQLMRNLDALQEPNNIFKGNLHPSTAKEDRISMAAEKVGNVLKGVLFETRMNFKDKTTQNLPLGGFTMTRIGNATATFKNSKVITPDFIFTTEWTNSKGDIYPSGHSIELRSK